MRGWTKRKPGGVVYSVDIVLKPVAVVLRIEELSVGHIPQVLKPFVADKVRVLEPCAIDMNLPGLVRIVVYMVRELALDLIDRLPPGLVRSAVDMVGVSGRFGILLAPVRFVVGRNLAARSAAGGPPDQILRLILATARDSMELPELYSGPFQDPHGTHSGTVKLEAVEPLLGRTWHLQ